MQNHDELGKLRPPSMSRCLLIAMHFQPDDIQSITSLKAAQKHLGVDLDAMKAIATALKERSLEMFETSLKKHKNGMSSLAIVQSSSKCATHHPLPSRASNRSFNPNPSRPTV